MKRRQNKLAKIVEVPHLQSIVRHSSISCGEEDIHVLEFDNLKPRFCDSEFDSDLGPKESPGKAIPIAVTLLVPSSRVNGHARSIRVGDDTYYGSVAEFDFDGHGGPSPSQLWWARIQTCKARILPWASGLNGYIYVDVVWEMRIVEGDPSIGR